MKTLILILFMMTPFCKKENNFYIKDGEIYIYEYAIKIPGQANVGFVIINDTWVIQKIDFKIYFSNAKIKKVLKYDGIKSCNYHYSQREEGNIFIEDLNLLCYSSENFTGRNKLIPDDIYKMISPDFLNMTNKERLKMLESLVK